MTYGEPISFEMTVKGQPLDMEQRIIGALVRRLGGTVTLMPEELGLVQGVALWEQGKGLRIDAGNVGIATDDTVS